MRTAIRGLTVQEVLHATANRLLYSKFYTVFYVSMIVLSLVSLVTALAETCPSVFFIVVESVEFWRSAWNYFDIIIVIFCLVTLILLSKGCSPRYNTEELLNTILLVVRNAFQVFRLATTIR
ncbi:hypothetical protein EV182_004828, partial [Spiromyces aspiralis]